MTGHLWVVVGLAAGVGVWVVLVLLAVEWVCWRRDLDRNQPAVRSVRTAVLIVVPLFAVDFVQDGTGIGPFAGLVAALVGYAVGDVAALVIRRAAGSRRVVAHGGR